MKFVINDLTSRDAAAAANALTAFAADPSTPQSLRLRLADGSFLAVELTPVVMAPVV